MSFSCFLASPRENLETNFIMESMEPPVICDVSVYLKSARAGAVEVRSKNEASEVCRIFMTSPPFTIQPGFPIWLNFRCIVSPLLHPSQRISQHFGGP